MGTLSTWTRDNVLSMDSALLRKRLMLLIATTCIATGLIGTWLALAPSQHYTSHLPFGHHGRPRVQLSQGTYLGARVRNDYPKPIEEFLGIPYGQSTGGARRFAAPLPVGPSSETFEASKVGYRCPSQASDRKGTHTQDEDCLNVNIYRPQKRRYVKKLPVLIHFYGGSFNFGMGNARQIDNLVGWSESPFIGVSFNYRVGALGFLSGKVAEKEQLLNAGLKDQVLLLEWVKSNIAAFGGDPDNITIMGTSAGAHGMGHHIMRNTAERPYFHKAIIESGGATARACYTPTNPMHEQQFDEFLVLLGLQDVPESEVIEKLRELDANDIKDASESIFYKYNANVRWPWQPVIDGPGGIIPIRPIDKMRSKDWFAIPILTGFNTNEGAMFVPHATATPSQFTSFFHTLIPTFTPQDLIALNAIYPDPSVIPSSKFSEDRTLLPGLNIGAQFHRIEQAYGQFAYVAPVKQQARYAVDRGAPVWLYHFAVNSSIAGGADHGNHVGFPTYNKDVRDRSPALATVAGNMHAYWTSFITTGDPNTMRGLRFRDRMAWPQYGSEELRGKMMVFGGGNDERAGGGHVGVALEVVEDDWMEKEVEFWWERVELFEV